MEGEEEPVIKLRNYIPEGKLEAVQVAAAKASEFEVGGENEEREDEQEASEAELAPKKANWDLKRDVQAKLQKLERRTQAAMIELMREEDEKRQEKLLK